MNTGDGRCRRERWASCDVKAGFCRRQNKDKIDVAGRREEYELRGESGKVYFGPFVPPARRARRVECHRTVLQ